MEAEDVGRYQASDVHAGVRGGADLLFLARTRYLLRSDLRFFESPFDGIRFDFSRQAKLAHCGHAQLRT